MFPRLGAQLLHAFFAADAEQADGDEWYGEKLSHVEQHTGFKVYLYIFGVFDKETHGKDERQTDAEEKPVPTFSRCLR